MQTSWMSCNVPKPKLVVCDQKVNEIILRAIGCMIKCQNFEEIYSLLLSLFITITNETNGVQRNTNIETSCQKHYTRLINTASTGIVELDQQLDTIIDCVNAEDNTCHEKHDYYKELEGINDINPFQSFAEKVFNENKRFIEERKMMKFLPLWSGMMVPFFGYGERVSSSVAVKSSFHKLKNVTLKHISLPTDVETFLENHIRSLKEAFSGVHICSLCTKPVHALPECSAHQSDDEEIQFPSILEKSSCSNDKCEKFQETYQPIYNITYNTTNGIISGLQEFINNQFKIELKMCNFMNKLEKSQCSSQRITMFDVSPLYSLIEILFWSGENMEQSSDAASHVKVKLVDIPTVVFHESTTYFLRGVLNYHKGKSQRRNAIGHYSAFCKREERN
ncbi:Uncharacterized protein FWK35_00025563 [Aphis craccivora]|uniref:Uncharacterized protein n=1 Tax=Aphis craccivora TaxID=307492 RepID=A0A6G0XWR3_APHCR|nr:Uncharacterized protein FWK35_00025563 [Aphis craccivora]